MNVIHLQASFPPDELAPRQRRVLDAIAPFAGDLIWRLYALDGVGGKGGVLETRAEDALDRLTGQGLPEPFSFDDLRTLVYEYDFINDFEAIGCTSVDALPLPSEEQKYYAADCIIHDYGVCLVDTRRPQIARALLEHLPFHVVSDAKP